MRDCAAEEPPKPAADDAIAHHDLAPRVAFTVTSVVILGFFAVAMTYVLTAHPSPLRLLSCLAVMAVLLFIQLFHSFPRLVPRLVPYRRATFAVQVVLTYAPFAVFKQSWLGMPGFLAGTSLLLLSGAAAWVAFGAVVVSSALVQFAVGYGVGSLGYDTVATALTGLVVFGLSRLSDMVDEVHRSRAELARLAVLRERVRFARDLHDLLGYSLSTITLKCELTHRLLPRQPARAQQEVVEVLRIARQTLADVRVVARGYRNMSLAAEAGSAESMLASVGIRTTVRIDCGPLSERADTVLATVLREGITNMLRHSRAQHCVIEAARSAGTVRLCLVNDGVVGGTETRFGGGSGIGNLQSRVTNLGGGLAAGVHADGRFHLVAEVPAAAGAACVGDPDAVLPTTAA